MRSARLSMNHPLVTIGVISWNRLNYLRATLESARCCIQYPNLEWIVSDNESEEHGLKEYLQSCSWVTHRIFKRQTHADAMNQIVEMASGEYLILWPEDVQFTIHGDWLVDLVEILGKNHWIGSVGLDYQRRVTLEKLYHARWWRNRGRVIDECLRYGVHFRRQRLLRSSRDFGIRTNGWIWPGICGSGIPSLTRTQVWRDLGPWRINKTYDFSIVDSSLGAEDDMVLRFYTSYRPLQTAFLLTPVAADIITDPTGCKAKVRGRHRYGVYMPPPDGLFYYRIRDMQEFTEHSGDMPIDFTTGVQPIGFSIPLDANGDRLKSSINLSVVYDMHQKTEVKYPLMTKPSS